MSNRLSHNGETPDIRLQGDFLLVNDELLTPRTSPEEFHTILSLGRTAILQYIVERYTARQQRQPDVTFDMPSVFAMRLRANSLGKAAVLSPLGLHNDTSVHRLSDELNKKFVPYWQAVIENGFQAEVRSEVQNSRAGGSNSVWLLLRHPEAEYDITLPWLTRALGFHRSDEMVQLEQRIEQTKDTISQAANLREAVLSYRLMGEQVVEQQPGGLQGAHKQLGLLLSVANLQRKAGFSKAAQRGLEDALLYADNLRLDDVARAIESELDSFNSIL
ncbi:MAG TPA: hypothetical protein VK983_03050 [Candidatus Limnocylindrales bacterium]|nr:hypothetical protein [Candidatus Limnocylindrales bacterium]